MPRTFVYVLVSLIALALLFLFVTGPIAGSEAGIVVSGGIMVEEN